MRGLLAPYQAELETMRDGDQPVLDHIAMAWKLHHHVIRHYRDTRPDWLFVQHEDLSTDPQAGFRSLYDQLDLTWSAAVEQAVEEHTGAQNPDQAEGKERALHLNSAAIRDAWKSVLSAEDVATIRARVAGVVEDFYGEDSW